MPNATWTITQTDFSPENHKAYEGLFTLGSGALHIRGALEEPIAAAPQNLHYWRLPGNVTSEVFREQRSKVGTFVPGVYGSHPLLNDELINLPNPLLIVPIVAGEQFDLDGSRTETHTRTLDLKTGLLTRTFTWRTKAGPDLRITHERFVSMARPRVLAQRCSIEVDAPTDLVLRTGIDATVTTNGFSHTQSVTASATCPHTSVDLQTDAGDRVRIDGRLVSPEATTTTSAPGMPEGGAWLATSVRLAASAPVVVERFVTIATSRDTRDRMGTDCNQAAEMGFDALLAESVEAWSARWSACDVRVEGDPHAQLALRTSLFHLFRAHPGEDDRVAIDAKGYAGEAYWGRFFWDTEMYLLPFYLYTEPARGKVLTDFRLRSLGGARRNAASLGLPGAKFAWESNPAGDECCPNWHYADHEIHISADVVFGIAHADAAHPGAGYLEGAAELVFDVARYWMARTATRSGDDHPSLLGVMGPDEYTPLEDNNAYTNALAAFALRTAAGLAERRGDARGERDAWRRTADTLPIPRRGALVLQSEGFDNLPAADFAARWTDRDRPFAGQVPQEYLYRTRCPKQADVLMLMWLFPRQFTLEEQRAAWDYYVPITTHDSSLSPAIHGLMACRLGLPDEAWRFWKQACDIDLRGGAAEGIHIAACAATWQMAILGFAGLELANNTETLTLTPRLPAGWSALEFPIVWRGSPLTIRVTRADVTITSRAETEIQTMIAGTPHTIAPGRPTTIALATGTSR